MRNKLFVGNLSFNTSEDTLKEKFAQLGSVLSVNLIQDKMTGRPRGFAFVEMSSEEEAKKVIEELNGKELDGRSLTINEAKERVARNGGNSGRSGYNSGRSNRSSW